MQTQSKFNEEENKMRENIVLNINNPHQLEKLYRENKSGFKQTFNQIYPGISENLSAQIWKERLSFDSDEISTGTRNELLVVLLFSFIAGLIAKIPDFFNLDPENFYSRNIAFIVFPMLITYFAWKHQLKLTRLVPVIVLMIIGVVYINFLPLNPVSDTLILACIHLPLFCWAMLGYTFSGTSLSNLRGRLEFLRYNGDLLVMTAVTLIAGALLTGVTIALFELIDIRIEEFYFSKVAIWGLAAIPVIGTFLVRTNPHLVNKVSPVIARIFTPLVFVMLVVYLIAVIYTGKISFADRDFLLIFNVLLIGVMALILFSIAENKNSGNQFGTYLLTGLSIVTIIVNCIALSAIVFRISEWGITPNRLAVLGSNILILLNLLIVTWKLFQTIRNSHTMERVEYAIAAYLPVYIIWTVLVTFLFPVLFNFK